MGRLLPATTARPAEPRRGPLPPEAAIALGLAALAAYAALLGRAMGWRGYDVWGALVIAPALVAVTLPLLAAMARRARDPWITVLLVGGLVLGLAASMARWYVGAEVYDGVADATGYVGHGERLAELYRAGVVDPDDLERPLIGTGFVRGLTGLVFAVVGASELGGFLIYAWLGFLGLLAFVAAFRTAVPDGAHRRYTALVLLLPSLLYWPASIGKEAWMMLALGVGALGAARLLARRAGGLWLLAAGLGAAALVRPHMALLLAVAATVAAALRSARADRAPLLGPAGKLVGVAALAVASVAALAQVEAYFGVDVDGQGSATAQVLEETERHTTTGGSAFDAERVRSPADLPEAFVAVLFRPFPWEGHNLQARLTGLEGLALLALVAASWRRLARLPALVRRSPYVALAGTYTLGFVVAFSSFGNFGLLARQRSQLLPLLAVLLCLPAVPALRERFAARNWEPVEARRP